MAEMDLFERQVADTLAWYADDVSPAVDAMAVAHRVAVERPRGRVIRRAPLASLAWLGHPVPVPVGLVLVLGLLLAALLGSALLVGSPWDRRLSLVPTPSPSPTPIIDGGTGVLATTRAHALPAAATCPPGSNPGSLGPTGQVRPPTGLEDYLHRTVAFDRRAGRIVLLADRREAGSRTWTFDVCTNTWQDMAPPVEPPIPSGAVRTWLVYDADSDRTVALVGHLAADRLQVWSYDLSTNRWAPGTDSPENVDVAAYGVTYHDPSGLVVVYDGSLMWAYDVDLDRWTVESQRPDATQPAGTGLPSGFATLAYDSSLDLLVVFADGPTGKVLEAWTFDPDMEGWRRQSALPAGLRPTGTVDGRTAVFDASTGWTALFSRGGVRVEGYHARLGRWAVLNDIVWGPTWCDDEAAAYDSLNKRIVCREYGGVSSFTTTDGAWQFLQRPTP